MLEDRESANSALTDLLPKHNQILDGVGGGGTVNRQRIVDVVLGRVANSNKC